MNLVVCKVCASAGPMKKRKIVTRMSAQTFEVSRELQIRNVITFQNGIEIGFINNGSDWIF